jgi:hypothetical protein
MDFRSRQQFTRALEPLRQALEAHRRSLGELESALIEFERPSISQNRGRGAPRSNSKVAALRDLDDAG